MFKKYVKAMVDFRLPGGLVLRDCAYRFKRNVRDVLPCQIMTKTGGYDHLVKFDNAEIAAAFQRAAILAIDRCPAGVQASHQVAGGGQ